MDPIVSSPAVRMDAPIATDWGMVVRVIGGIAIVGAITANQGTSPWIVAGLVDQGAPALDANSWPIHIVGTPTVLQGTSPWVISGTVGLPTGTLANGVETAVAAAAVEILAANASRKSALIQNTGAANIRVGVTGVAITTGIRLTPGGMIIFDMPYCPTQAIFAIREGAISSTAFAQEIT